MKSFQHHYLTEGEATVRLTATVQPDGTRGMRITVETDLPPNSITIEVPDVKEVILK